MPKPLAYISHSDCRLHEMGPHHPESPRRLEVIEQALKDRGLWEQLSQIDAPLATLEDLRLAHTDHYLDFLKIHAPATGIFRLDPDTAMNPFTWAAALRAAGALTHAVDLVLEGRVERVFCAVRPPGHHAERQHAMGFCFLNNVAIGVLHFLKRCPQKKVVVFDFDVHHGNGTEDILKDNPQVFLASLFQHPNYPGKPFEHDHPRIVNAALPPGAGSPELREVVGRRWLPRVREFKPDIFFFSAGFDAHSLDPLAALEFQTEDYGWMTREIVGCAQELNRAPLISTLEGGYHLKALADSACAHIAALLAL